MEYEDLLAILAGQTGKTKEEIKELPPEEFAKQLVMYVNTLEPETKKKLIDEFYNKLPLLRENTPSLEVDKDFIKTYSNEIKIENGQYRIIKPLNLKSDFTLPKGIYF